MPRYIIEELQTVRAVRVIEAENEDAAYDAFCNGEGEPTGKDGEVTRADLVSIVQAEPSAIQSEADALASVYQPEA